MEHFNPELLGDNEKPDKTGAVETSKKKKKKTTTRVPLPVKKEEAAEAPAKDTQKQPKQQKAESTSPGERQNDKTETKDTDQGYEHSKEQSDSQPEAAVDNREEAEFLGELVIDHSDDQEEPQDFVDSTDTMETDNNVQPEAVESVITEAQPLPELDIEVPADPDPPVESTSQPEYFNPAPQPASPLESPPYREAVNSMVASTMLPNNPQFNETAGMVNPSSSYERPQVPPEGYVAGQEAANRSYRAEKRGLSRGVLTGGLVGWWLGRRGRRGLEKQVASTKGTLDSHEEAIKKLAADRDAQKRTYEKRISTIQRTQEELRNMVNRNWNEKIMGRTYRAERPAAVKTPSVAETLRARPIFEVPKHAVKPERQPVPSSEVAPEHKTVTEKDYVAPESRHFETSAWHRIEVDDKTGRAVERSSSEYGQAFHSEQQQERLAQGAAKAQTAVHVGSLVGAHGSDARTIQGVTSFSNPEPASVPTRPKYSSIQLRSDLSYARSQIVMGTTNPSTWFVSLAIVVLMVVTGIL